jgi:hypothetical protein
MVPKRVILHFATALSTAAALAAAVLAAPPDKTVLSELVTITGEVAAVDASARTIAVLGPLGGYTIGKVSDEVKNLGQVKVGDMVTLGFYESRAISVKRKGETAPIFAGSTASAQPGDMPAGYVATRTTTTMTVVAVDPVAKSLVVQDQDGKILARNVDRPEFASKLAQLKVGDQLEVVSTEAYIVSVDRPTAGERPSITRDVSTVVIDHGEVVRRMNNTLFVRNQKGKIVKVVVDPEFKFMLDGKEATVTDLKPGAKLTRTAFRVVESVEYEAQ